MATLPLFIHNPDYTQFPQKRYVRPIGTSGLGGSTGFFKLNPIARRGNIYPPGMRPTVTGGTGAGTTPPPWDPYAGYMPYNDVYSGLLSSLGSIKDATLAGLKSDLQNRNTAIQGIVNNAQAPLNADYNTAIQEAAAVNDAVANRLAAQGGTATTDLRSQLAALGQDPNAATAKLDKYYSGLGGANYAMDAGDVQRLIGRRAEEAALLAKQPALIAQQLNQDYAGQVGNVLSDYFNNAFGVAQKGADARSAYDQAKFDFGQGQIQKQTDAVNQATAQYWDNYWKKQDMLFRRWQTQIASGDKKAADATKKQIAAAQNQSAQDIAQIRAQATVTSAQTRAAATTTAAATRAGATKSGENTAASNVNKQRAYNAALNAVIDPKTGLIRSGVNPTGFNADWTMTRIVNTTLKSYGINPQSPQGRAVIASVLSQANNRKFALDPTSRYRYDPNWVKKAKAARAAKLKVYGPTKKQAGK